MDGKTQEISVSKQMKYSERLANYEREKMEIPRLAKDNKTYEAALKALAKKWRI